MTDILNSDFEIEVMGVAADPCIAADKMKQEVLDVIILDVEMPRMKPPVLCSECRIRQ